MDILKRIQRDIEAKHAAGEVVTEVPLNYEDFKELKRVNQLRWKRPGRAREFYWRGPAGLVRIFEVEDSPPYPS